MGVDQLKRYRSDSIWMTTTPSFSNDRNTIRRKLEELCDGLDPRAAELLERGCYNFAIEQCTFEGVNATATNPLFIGAYSACAAKLLWNLDPCGFGANQELHRGMMSGSINPRFAAWLSVEELNPLSLAAEKAAISYRENMDDPLAISRRYRCPKCRESSTRLRNEQIRCGDEGATGFADCTICGYTWKIY
jgi:DNA-directed RNA polymerase subunit M/transcription elongation factor TFIIS